jgi:hypothetical protein
MRAQWLSLQWRIAQSRIAQQQPVRILQRSDRGCKIAVAKPQLPTRSCEKPQSPNRSRQTAVAKPRQLNP